jgi:hypothetical protein
MRHPLPRAGAVSVLIVFLLQVMAFIQNAEPNQERTRGLPGNPLKTRSAQI